MNHKKCNLFRCLFFLFNPNRKFSRLMGLLLILPLALVLEASYPLNPSESQWSPPDIVTDQTGHLVYFPALAVDRAGNVHTFWSYAQNQTSQFDIYYSVWNGSYWSIPVDLFTDGTQPAVTIDSQDIIHLIWVGSDLEYSSVNAQKAGDIKSWKKPDLLYSNTFISDIQSSKNNTLYIVTPGAGQSIYFLRSNDQGQTWSAPVNIPLVDETHYVNYPRIAVDENNHILHMVWEEISQDEGNPPAGVYYAQSKDDGQTWSEPIQLAGYQNGEAGVAVDGQGVVHVAWNGNAVLHGRYHRYSTDHGMTWSEPVNFTHGSAGLTGPPSMAIDSSGRLHIVTSDKTSQGNGPCYTYWDGNELAQFVVVAPDNSWYGERTRIAVGLGNQLHILSTKENQILWHSTKLADAPPIPPQVLPTTTPDEVIKKTEPPILPKTTLSATNVNLGFPSASNAGINLPLIVSFIVACIIVGAFVFYQRSRFDKRS